MALSIGGQILADCPRFRNVSFDGLRHRVVGRIDVLHFLEVIPHCLCGEIRQFNDLVQTLIEDFLIARMHGVPSVPGKEWVEYFVMHVLLIDWRILGLFQD